MRVKITPAALLLTLFFALSYQAPMETDYDVMQYLERYGYLARMDMNAGQLRTAEQFEEALRHFQRYANISVTGNMDSETMNMMRQPRCGLPDMMGTMDEGGRRKRYSTGPVAWPRNRLTYRITKSTPDLSRQEVVEIIQRAFDVWAAETPLTFVEIDQGTPDIVIFFDTGSHGDGDPFDGPGGVLAHAYFPTTGDAHFDDDEDFTADSFDGINLFQVAAHEFGHSLGLGHSDVPGALMAPFFQGYVPNFQLHEDDVMGIQYLYGMSDNDEVMPSPDPNVTPNNSPVPDCEGIFDAITRTQDGSSYAFRGNRFWRMGQNDNKFGMSQSISAEWSGLPNDLDAALYWPGDGKTFFFKGHQYWRFENQVLDSGYPRPLTDWGIPSGVDAAFVWGGNGNVYFIKDDQYYRYSNGVDEGYPKPLSVWEGLPDNIDAVFQWNNGLTYFFAGNEYYRFNDQEFSVEDSYPRYTSLWWMGCHLDMEETTRAMTTRSICDGNFIAGSEAIRPNAAIMLFVLSFMLFV